MRSRTRSTYPFLASLDASTETWATREAQGYQQHVAEVADTLRSGGSYVCSWVDLSDAAEEKGQIRTQPLWTKVEEDSFALTDEGDDES